MSEKEVNKQFVVKFGSTNMTIELFESFHQQCSNCIYCKKKTFVKKYYCEKLSNIVIEDINYGHCFLYETST